MAVWLVGCGSGFEAAPSADEGLVTPEADAGPVAALGAGGSAMARLVGGGTGGAAPVGAGGATPASSPDAGSGCRVDADCAAGWHCGEKAQRTGVLECHRPCHAATTGTSEPDGQTGCKGDEFCVAYVGLAQVDACTGTQASAPKFCAGSVPDPMGCPY